MNSVRILESGSAKGRGKVWEAKLIAADTWGASAYYSSEVLARDASTAFPAGTKMFENHLTESETWERPVGDVSKLVGKLITPGEFRSDHPEGPGVYADVEFYDSYVDRVNEIGEDVGLSVDGAADYVEGEIAGRFGRIVTGIPYIKSVDVVVAAGAGGKLISIRESAGPMAGIPINKEGDQSVTALTKEDFETGIASALEGFATKIQESLAPLANLAAPAEPVVVNVATDAAEAGVVEAPAAEAVVETEAEAEVEIDLAEVATKFAAAGLPSEVMPNVITTIREGATVDQAIEGQVKIREAFKAQEVAGTVRIVEAGDRSNPQGGTDVRAGILAAFK